MHKPTTLFLSLILALAFGLGTAATVSAAPAHAPAAVPESAVVHWPECQRLTYGEVGNFVYENGTDIVLTFVIAEISSSGVNVERWITFPGNVIERGHADGVAYRVWSGCELPRVMGVLTRLYPAQLPSCPIRSAEFVQLTSEELPNVPLFVNELANPVQVAVSYRVERDGLHQITIYVFDLANGEATVDWSQGADTNVRVWSGGSTDDVMNDVRTLYPGWTIVVNYV